MLKNIKFQNTNLSKDQLIQTNPNPQDSMALNDSKNQGQKIQKNSQQKYVNTQTNNQSLYNQNRPNQNNFRNEDTDDEISQLSQINISAVYNRFQNQEKYDYEEDKQIELLNDESEVRTIIQDVSQLSQDHSRNELISSSQSSNQLFQRKSTLKSKRQQDFNRQQTRSYNIEQTGCLKRRQLFETGLASTERQAIKKEGLDEEYVEITFDGEEGASDRTKKNIDDFFCESSNAKSMFKDITENNDDSFIDIQKIKKDGSSQKNIDNQSRSLENNKNNRRFSERLTINFHGRNQKRQKTDNSSQNQNLTPQSSNFKEEALESLTCSRASNRQQTPNRNNAFEEDNVQEFSQRRKSKFLANQKLKLSNSPTLNGQYEATSPFVDKLNLSFFSSATIQEELRNNQLAEINTPLAAQLIENKIINSNTNKASDLKWKLVGVAQKVKKFSKILIDHLYYRDYKNINNMHFKAIDDQSFFLDDDLKVNLPFFKNRLRVIEPSDTFALFWNFLLLVSISISIILIPLQTSFSISFIRGSGEHIGLEIIPKFILSADIILNFFQAYYHKGQLIVKLNKIFLNYIQYKFFFNLITTLSYLIQSDEYKLIQWICMLRVFQLPQLIGMIDEHFQLQQKYNTSFELIKLLLLVVLMAHFVGCGFHYCALSEIQKGSDQTWLNQFQFIDDKVQLRYINSIYFAFITMITVGYGDIVPISYLEKQYVIVITVISSGLFGYSINTIEFDQCFYFKRQQKYDINIYLSNRQISKKVQLQILKAIEYKNISQANKHLRGEEILQNLSQNIQSEFKKEFFGKILVNCKVFKQNFSQKARDQFCLHMKENIFQPGDCIFSEHAQNENIYFIYQGEVKIFQDISNERKVVGVAKTGDTLGMFGFFTSYQEQIGAISSETTYLAYCNKKDFLSVLKQFPRDYENYCRIRDNLTIYKRYTDQTCFSCNQRGHEILKCPFYDKRREPVLTIYRHNIDRSQVREKRIRNCSQKFNTLSKNKIVRKVLREIRWQYINETDNEFNDIDSQAEEEIMNSDDLYFYMLVPQFRWENNQIQLIEGEEEDDTFCEYYQQMVDDIDNTTIQESNISKPQTSNKQNVYDAKQPVIECEVETSDSDNENTKQNITQTEKVTIENFNINSSNTIKIEQKDSIYFDEQSQNSNLQLSHQQFLLVRQKAKECSSQFYQKTSSIDFQQKQLNLSGSKKELLNYRKTNESDNKDQTENNSKQQNTNISDQIINNSQGEINNQLNASNSHSNTSSSTLINNTQQNTSIILQGNFKKGNTLMSSIIQQKYSLAQQKRGSQDKNFFQKNQIQQKAINPSHIQENSNINQQKFDAWQYQQQIQKIDQLINNNQEINQEHELFIQLDLDSQREYKSYFPNNNVSNVLKSFQKFQRKVQSKKDQTQKITRIKGRKNAHKLTLVNLLKKDFQFKSFFSYQNQQ